MKSMTSLRLLWSLSSSSSFISAGEEIDPVIRDHGKNFGVLDREHFVEAPGSVPGVGTEVHDRGYDRDEPVIFVEAGEIFSG